MARKKEKFKLYNVEELKEAVSSGICWTDVCRTLNISVCGFNFDRLRELCAEYEINYNHFDVKRSFRRNKKEWTPELLFIKDCEIHRSQLRQVLIRIGHYTNQCEMCGCSATWNGKPLTIEIDHINGDHRDNRKENLRWLCPNCHSQTPTYKRGKTE